MGAFGSFFPAPPPTRALIAGHQALLLRQHGSLTYGSYLDEACDHLERMEHAARIFWLAHSLGRVQRLPPALMARLDSYRRGRRHRMKVRDFPCASSPPAGPATWARSWRVT